MNITDQTFFPVVITGHVDHGKSTLIGRLLYETGMLKEERYSEVVDSSSRIGKGLDLAFVPDSLEEERDRGITIDTTQIHFVTKKRPYVIIDAPGHKEFIKNMITGASYAEAAILIIDACEGVKDQTRRHLHLLRLVGIKDIRVLINKMDLVDYSEEVFHRATAEIAEVMSERPGSFTPSSCIPVSALKGINIATNSGAIPWYRGPCVLEALDSLDYRPLHERAFRFPVQDVYFDEDDGPVVVGRIESGAVTEGDAVEILPWRIQTRVKAIRRYGQEALESAGYGESVGLCLENADSVQRGSVIGMNGNFHAVRKFRANIFWFYGTYSTNDRIRIRCTTQEMECTISIDKKIDPAAAEKVIYRPEEIMIGEIGEAMITAEALLTLDPFAHIPEMGRFVLEKDGVPVGGGIVL